MEREKINNITAYLLDHFKEPLCIEQAAQLVHLSPSAFCRYFKKITRRTFIETVVDYRIDYAARHLRNTDMPIAHIAFDSGFADMSNFYRAFKKRKNLSPLTYRKIFLK
ncbi:AraC family transcriptional regulator [Olivibacter sp. CPCC 100613]|uniref:AraC family transcriptional regulator n=1 Tax=Olivibacter sp. CPCC 100613 TaxID=3079931 RepID=UPI002FFB8A8F